NQYYSSDSVVSPGMRISLINVGAGVNDLSRMCYNTTQSASECGSGSGCVPAIQLQYLPGCLDGSSPTQGFHGSYICHDVLVDSIMCRPTINDTAVNFYRVGILGNWRMDRAYTYYASRLQTDPSTLTNIRTDGAIKSFAPYWNFTDSTLSASTDSTRWVW